MKGDSRVAEISAASILAKVTRDAEMATLDLAFPHYGFAQHKGYPTAVHLQKLQEHGATEHHRRSFGPVKRAWPGVQLSHRDLKMAEPRFVHLRVHSDYSMIDGLAKTGPLVKKAASLGMPALAITDFTNLCGLVKFYGTGHGAGIKPIVGADFHVQCDLLGDEFTELTVLAANNTGYQNLTLLISAPISAATAPWGRGSIATGWWNIRKG